MNDYSIDQLVNTQQIEQLLEAHVLISGIPCGLMDNDQNIIVGAGLQEICACYHWGNQKSFARCWRNDPDTKEELRLFTGERFECRCKNGMINIAIPIIIEGKRLGVLFSGQFFYDNEPPDLDWFRQQAEELDFDVKPYLAAVHQAPVFNHTQVDNTMRFLHQLVQLLAETGLVNLRRRQELEERNQLTQELFVLNTAINHAGEAFFLIDDRQCFKYVNDAACRSLGYSRDELLNLTTFDIDPDITPETLAEIKEQFDRGMSLAVESRHRTKDGKIFPVEITGNSFKHNGTRLGLITARDITERKHAEALLRQREQEFRTLAENSPDNIVRYDTNCRMIYLNPRMEKTLGISVTDLLGKMPIEKPTGPKRTKYQEKIKQVLVTGEEGEIDLILPDTGEGERYHNIRFIAERDSDGNVVGVLTIGRDITERRQAEQKLREKQQRLSDMELELTLSKERERRSIAVDLHDTLGQDLTLTRMKLGSLNKTNLSPEQRTLISEIKGLTENSISRVRSLTKLLCPPVLESAGLEAALKWLARQIETDYGLQIAFSDDLQDKTVARERQIELYNCVRELLINVAKHAGTTTACLSVCRVADTLVIRVEDDGVGFDTEAIFTNSDGDGFGLFTISRRVTHMGGIFQITSKQGSGTEITMNVPLAAMSIPDTAAGE